MDLETDKNLRRTMERLPDVVNNDDGTRTAHFRDEEEGTHLVVNVTHEGVIMDCYAVDHDGNDQIIGTFGMMADEIFDWLTKGSGGMLERTIDPSLSEVADVAKWAADGGTEAQDGE